MVDRLTVLAEDGTTVVGFLGRANGGTVNFEYANTYTGTPLSLSMSVNSIQHRDIANTLWGLLPDNDVVVGRWATSAGVSALDLIGLLGAYGSDVAGAMQYVTHVGTDEPAWYEQITDKEIAQRIAALRSDSAAWRGGDGGRWSLGGAQAKFTLAQLEGTWRLPRGSAASTHIVKPGITGLADHDVNEHVCLTAARSVGLHAAASELRTFGSERAIVVARYDRIVDGELVTRVHQEDMCQALGIPPAKKYENDGGPGVAQLAGVIRSASSKVGVDSWRLAEMLAFNWLIGGSDAHAKNFSMLLSGEDARLAPMYDVGSLLPYEHVRKVSLAMKIGGEYKLQKLARRHWSRVASQLAVDQDRFAERIGQLARDIPASVSDAGGATPEAAPIIESVADWCASVGRWWRSTG